MMRRDIKLIMRLHATAPAYVEGTSAVCYNPFAVLKGSTRFYKGISCNKKQKSQQKHGDRSTLSQSSNNGFLVIDVSCVHLEASRLQGPSK